MIKWLKRKVLNSNYYLRPLRDSSKFEFFQSKGIHVLPNDFYYPVPDTSKLDDHFFNKKYDWAGIDLNEDAQCELLQAFISKFKNEYSRFPYKKTPIEHEFYWENGGFQCLDALSLYGMIRHYKPRRIIEIGGGNSTMLAAQAVQMNLAEQKTCELITIEPYPWSIHKTEFPGFSRLIEKRVEELPLSFFDELQANDILFIDSSHVATNGSDVTYYFMELLPRLHQGVIVHFHDIFLPEEYPQEWIMKEHRFFNEQYLLRAFISFNDSFKILFAGRFLQSRQPQLTNAAFDFYPGEITKAGSFWIQRIK